jgi:hypothetical protein
MSQLNFPRVFRVFGLLFLAAVLMFSLSACKQKAKPDEAVREVGIEPTQVTVDSVAAVMGKAGADKSGVFDVGKGERDVQIIYHFYTTEPKDIDDDIGREMGPKIRDLYKKFKTIHRVEFLINILDPDKHVDWVPYCTFAITRKVMDETDWTKLLDDDFFKVVQELKYTR